MPASPGCGVVVAAAAVHVVPSEPVASVLFSSRCSGRVVGDAVST